MKLSNYNIVTKLDEDLNAIYNTRTGALLKVTEKGLDKLISASDEVLKELCIKNGFVVDDNFDEKSYIDFFRYSRFSDKDNSCSYVVLPTTACNARCFYCYEEGIKNTTMSMEIAEKTANYIISNSKGRDIRLQWFGGEPLLGLDIIEYITKRIQESLDYDQKYTATMITNATLLDSDLIKKLSNEWYVKRLQITIDGDRNEYVKRKGLNDKSLYDKVIVNIGELLKFDITVTIRINFDRNNYAQIFEVIDLMETLYGCSKNLNIYAVPLFSNGKFDKNDCFDKDELDDCFDEIYNKLYEKGFIKSPRYFGLGNIKTRFCGAMSVNHAVIAADGKIYKCQHINLNAIEPIGNVNDGIRLTYDASKWMSPMISKECSECKCLPLCQGGCRAKMFDDNVYDCCLFKYTTNSTIKTLVKLCEER